MTKEKCLIEQKGECILKDETAIVLTVSAITGIVTAIAIINAPIINGLIQGNILKGELR